MAERIRVAIIGSGLGGCTLASGLVRLPNVDFDIYEAKPALGERGTVVGLGPNAEKALLAMGLNAHTMFKKVGSQKMSATTALVATGEHKGKPMLQLPGGVNILSRKAWLDELTKALPPERIHLSKSLDSITRSEDLVYTLHFKDGSTAEADAVVGCDGIRSKMRQLILTPGSPGRVDPVFGGYWDARGSFTVEQAVERLGTDLIDPTKPIEVALVGDGAFMIFAPNQNQTEYHMLMSAIAGPDYDRTAWKAALSREFLERQYGNWDERLRTGIIDCLMGEETGTGVVYSQWESPEAPTYCKEGLCMMGDAAHAPTPWLGSGAGMATEDAAVLTALLGSVQRRDEVASAMRAFDQTRRGRTQWVVRQSQISAKLLTGQLGLEASETAHLQAENWWKDIWSIDMNAHIEEAIEAFKDLKDQARK